MTVRAATADDLEEWLDVFEEVVNEELWLGTQPPLDRAERRERLLAAIQDGRTALLVAVDDDGRIVGQSSLDVAPYGVASLGMSVRRTWRGQGVGSALLAEAIAAARRMGAHKLTLQVWPHNTAARRLYRRFGFEEEGRLRRHYLRRNGELWDAVVMGLVLDHGRPGSSLPEEPEEPAGG